MEEKDLLRSFLSLRTALIHVISRFPGIFWNFFKNPCEHLTVIKHLPVVKFSSFTFKLLFSIIIAVPGNYDVKRLLLIIFDKSLGTKAVHAELVLNQVFKAVVDLGWSSEKAKFDNVFKYRSC